MELDFEQLSGRDAYRWMASAIIPRPVAWVSSLDDGGVSNLAPFSFFQMIAGHPPTLMFSPLVQATGAAKDTAANIRSTGEFVVNLVSYAQVRLMNETSFTYPPGTSEIEQCRIATLPSEKVRPVRVAGAPVSFECKLVKLMPYPESSPSCYVIFGGVVYAHVDEAVLDAHGYINPKQLDLVSRMGGNWYGRTRSEDNFELERPPSWDRPPAAT